jgi:hypothetical protein
MGRREQLIKKLVTTFHLSVPERQELSPIHVVLDEVEKAIREELSEYGWYPRNWRPHTAGDIVWEGYAIEAVEGAGFRVHNQASFAIEPTRLRGSKTLDFASVDEAIDFYLHGEFPSGSIDGIPLVPNSSRQS